MTNAYVNGQDTQAFTNQNGITGTWTAATGVLALTGTATVASYQTALRSASYTNASDNPSTNTRTVTFVVNDGTVDFLHRESTGGSTGFRAANGPILTYWLKLVRSGNIVTGYSAPDSSGSAGAWTQVGTQSITMASTILVGLATTSNNASSTTTGTYDNVSVTPYLSYFNTIQGTGGLLSYYRLGEVKTSSDTFGGTAGATLQSRPGEIGATWSRHINSSGDAVLTDAGRIRKGGTTAGALYYSAAVPASANYTVEADVYVASSLANDKIGIVGRFDAANTPSATGYVAFYVREAQMWVL